MADRTTRKELFLHANDAGFVIATWAPGDGVTRYRFFDARYGPTDYHAGHHFFTALGVAEAMTFVRGVKVGKQLANVRARGRKDG